MSTLAETKVITTHLPLPLADKLDAMAAQLDRSRGWIVKQAVSAWVQHEEELSRLTREAMVDVDEGRVVNHSAVRTWADSLSQPTELMKAAKVTKTTKLPKVTR
jgi:predicted transcriptional regulator